MKKVAIVIGMVLLFAGQGLAQTNDEGLAFLQFNFTNPGARSLAMGGAFVGLADDATAALANPAGPIVLERPEVSVEFSSTKYENEIPYAGGLETFRVLNYVPNQTLTIGNFSEMYAPVSFPETVNHISFASIVYPLRQRKFVIAGFYNEQAKFKRNFQTQGMQRCNADDPACLNPLFPDAYLAGFENAIGATENSIDFNIKNIGASFSVRPTPKFSIGGSIIISDLDLNSTTFRTFANSDPAVRDAQNFYSLTGNDTKFAFTVGAIASPSDLVSFGVVYARRARFDVQSHSCFFGGGGEDAQTCPDPAFQREVFLDTELKIPDSFAFGISVHPVSSLSVNFDVNRVLYSQMMDGYYNANFRPGDNLKNEVRSDFQSTTLEVEDGTEYHFGVEQTFFLGDNKVPFSVRGGYWRDPFHSVIQTVDDGALMDSLFAFIRPNGNLGGSDHTGDTRAIPFFSRTLKDFHHPNHYTFGAGVNIQDSFTIDFGYDYSKNWKRFTLSTVIYL